MHQQPDQPRSPLRLLLDPTLGPYVVGKFLSACGTWMQNLGAAILMFQLTRSAFMVASVSMLQFAGPLLLSLWAGSLNDRLDRRKLLMVGRGLSGVSVTTLALLLFTRGTQGFGGPAVILASVGIMGLGHALSGPAQQALVPALVRRADLEPALALVSAGPSIARAVGPALASLVLVTGGPAMVFLLAGFGHFCFVLALVFVRAQRAQQRSRRNVFGGLAYLRDDPKARALMFGVALLGFGADPVITLTPSISAQIGSGDEAVGIFVSSFGVGAILNVLLIARIRRHISLRLAGVTGLLLLAGGLLVVAASSTVILVSLGFLAAGMGFMIGSVSLNTRIQRRLPDELRGRVMALWSVAFVGSRPIAALMNGTIADLVSLRLALVATAAVAVLASLLARVSYREL